MRKLAFVLVAVVSLGLVGCNTVSGFGQDLQHAGEAISGKADQTKGDHH